MEGFIFVLFGLTFARFNNVLKYLLMTVLIGYGFAWVGHFIFENNKPATFIYPSYSLICDFRLWFSIIQQLYMTNFDFQSVMVNGVDPKYWF